MTYQVPTPPHPLATVADLVADDVRALKSARRAAAPKPLGYIAPDGVLLCRRCVDPTARQLETWITITSASPGKPEPCDLCGVLVGALRPLRRDPRPIQWSRIGDGVHRCSHGYEATRTDDNRRPWLLTHGARVVDRFRTFKVCKDEVRAIVNGGAA